MSIEQAEFGRTGHQSSRVLFGAAAAGWAVDNFGAHGGFAVAAMATGVMAVLAVAGLRAPEQHATAAQLAE